MVSHWKQNATVTLKVVSVVTFLIYGPLLVFSLVQTVYDDHESLATQVKELHHYAENKNQLGDQLRQLRSETRHWQDAYQRVSRGETHPDRILSSEETNTLFEELRRISKDVRNKDYVKLDFGSVQDREASHLAVQLFRTLKEAHWNCTWKAFPTIPPGKEIPKELQFIYMAPAGVTIWTDQPNNMGMFLMWALKDVGLDATVNPGPTPPGFKGTLVWVGYKQIP
jgi:hypothetical protein